MTRSRTILSFGAGLLTLAACTADPGSDSQWSPGEFRLVSFDSCDQAEQELRATTSTYVGPWGFGVGRLAMDGAAVPQEAAGDAALAPEAARAAPAPAPGADQDYSGTNVHEAGVDEPDMVKTDGRRIVTVSGGVLRVVDAARQVQTGTLDLRPANQDVADLGWWQPADLLLHGDHALVLLRDGWWGDLPAQEQPASDIVQPDIVQPDIALPAEAIASRLLLVDLTGSPRVVSEYTIDGSLVDARAVDQIARVVVRSAPRISFPEIDGEASEAERTAANRGAVASADIDSWLPRYRVTAGGQTGTGQVECTAMSRPETYTGTSMLTVLTFDMSASQLGDGDPVSVVADGDTVYSNGSSLYIASDQRWRIMPDIFPPPEVDERTEIYKFDTSEPGAPRYAGAGAVPGFLVNQYAMSEWEGHLRVATTSGQTWAEEGEQPPSESAVYVLAERDGQLVRTGSVSGLGKGERIYSVRFTGPIGYVVTFRETDPLYTLDLRDPTAPAVLGELKISGYSAYLHPLGDGRLIGVGQEADQQGRTQGTQVSLFDVTDLANPARLAQHHVQNGHSEAEFDPHAFLWWPDDRLLVIPLTVYDWSRDAEQPPQSTALVLRVESAGFIELGTISQPPPPNWDYSGEIRRSLVIGDTLWTVSDQGLAASALSTLDQTAWIPFT